MSEQELTIPERKDRIVNVIRNLVLVHKQMNALSTTNSAAPMFAKDRQYYTEFGYNNQPTFTDKLRKYRRQDIAGRVIDAEPLAIWSKPPTLKGPPEEWITRWEKVVKSVNLWPVFQRLDKLAGLDTYAVLLIGVEGINSFEQPLELRGRPRNVTPDNPTGSRKLLYLQPYAAEHAKIIRLEERINNPNFGKPSMYDITSEAGSSYFASNNPSPNETTVRQLPLFQNGGKSSESFNPTGALNNAGQSRTLRVRSDYIVHIAENILEDDVYGFPRMDRIYNLLDDALKVSGSSAESFWLQCYKGIQFDVDKEVNLSEDDVIALEAQVDEYVNKLRRVIQTKGVTVNPLDAKTVDPKSHFDVIVSLISGATGIPKRILFGSEAGQLASQQDRANWAERIDQRRTMFAEVTMLKPFIQKCISLGILPEFDVDEIEYEWPESYQLSQLEKAEVSARKGRAAGNVLKPVEAGLLKPEEAGEILDIEIESGRKVEDPATALRMAAINNPMNPGSRGANNPSGDDGNQDQNRDSDTNSPPERS